MGLFKFIKDAGSKLFGMRKRQRLKPSKRRYRATGSTQARSTSRSMAGR